MTAVQLDLFGEVLTAETGLRVDAMTCLRDAVPGALRTVLGDLVFHRGEVAAGMSGAWAYAVRQDGFYFEGVDTWGGWYARPRYMITWAELDALVGADPRLAEVEAWAAQQREPGLWRNLSRPYELWPDPDDWHPSYITGDHERPGWDERIAAWRTVLTILDDAISRETP